MNSGLTATRVYDALKMRILNRHYRPGQRLDPALLGNELSSSVTPVRDALNRLLGEALVEARTGDGFHLPPIDAPALQDLYDWQGELLALALSAGQPDVASATASRKLSRDSPADAATLFAIIAANSRNAEHWRAIENLADRMHAVRLVEGSILSGLGEEAEALADAYANGSAGDLRQMLVRYHKRRRKVAAELTRALYRD